MQLQPQNNFVQLVYHTNQPHQMCIRDRDVADIQRIMGISRASAYELVHTPGFPAFRRGRLIKVSKIAFFEWMAKGSETVPRSDK